MTLLVADVTLSIDARLSTRERRQYGTYGSYTDLDPPVVECITINGREIDPVLADMLMPLVLSAAERADWEEEA